VKTFVEGQQFKNRDFGDREYDEMRTQLAQLELTVSAQNVTQAEKNPRVIALREAMNSLRFRLADKERSLAQAFLASVTFGHLPESARTLS